MARFARSVSLSLPLVTALLVGCAAPDEQIDEATQDVTGGSTDIEPSTVYLFGDRVKPDCAGALIGETVAVTAKACAKNGMIVVRAGTKPTQARVRAVHVPPGADADIAVVELDRRMPGPHAVITHAPLRDGYSIDSTATVREDDPTARARVSSVPAQMVSETDTHGAIITSNGGRICKNDVGAPVCSSITAELFGQQVVGTCGLAGIVVAPPDAPVVAAPQNPSPTSTDAAPPADDLGCVPGAWKVAQLGRHADFLRQFAPQAFQPIEVRRVIFGADFGTERFAPEGLWGFRSRGTVKSCKIETASLSPVAVSSPTKVTARVSFTDMESRATAWGRVGIAPKSAPTAVRWLPAKATTEPRGRSFETTFEGTVSADKDGDFIVVFRASANGGETWTKCDVDGSDNGFSLDKALSLKVGAGDKEGEAKPQGAPPSPTEPSDATDARPSADDDEDLGEDFAEDDADGEEPVARKKKAAAASGCSAASGGAASGSSFLLVGLAAIAGAFARRRRA